MLAKAAAAEGQDHSYTHGPIEAMDLHQEFNAGSIAQGSTHSTTTSIRDGSPLEASLITHGPIEAIESSVQEQKKPDLNYAHCAGCRLEWKVPDPKMENAQFVHGWLRMVA
jgi:hypothetical protein